LKLAARVEGIDHAIDVERRGAAYAVMLDGRSITVDARAMEGFFTSILINGKAYEVTVEPESDSWRVQIGIDVHRVRFLDPLRPAGDKEGAAAGDGHGRSSGSRQRVAALMPGKIVRVLVKQGDEVKEGQGLLVVEAMKMENEVAAPSAGRVLELKVSPGEPVEAGATLAVIG
jgi:acetyl/propionyl-CoA carboxylase alpha subunit